MSPRLLVLSGVMFIVATNSSVIAGLLPDIARDLHTDQATVSYSVTVYALIVAVVAPLASTFLSRVPRGLLMAAGCALFAIGTAIAGLGGGAGAFIGGRAVAAVGGAALVPVAMAVGSALVPPAHRGKAISIIGVGFTVAGAFGAPLGTVLGSWATWRVPLLGLAGLGLVIGAVLAFVLRASVLSRITYVGPVTSGVVSPTVGDNARVGTAEAHGASDSAPAGMEDTAGTRDTAGSDAGPDDGMHPLRNPRIVFTVLATLALMLGFNAIVIFSARLFGGATGGDGSRLAVLLMAFGIASIVGNSLAGPLTDRFGNRIMGISALAVLAILLIVMTMTIDAFAPALLAMALTGCAMSMVTVPIQHRLLELGRTRTTQVMAWNSTAMYLGLAAAPLVANAVLGLGGEHALPVAAGSAAAVALLLYLAGQAGAGAKRVPRARRSARRIAGPNTGSRRAPCPAQPPQ